MAVYQGNLGDDSQGGHNHHETLQISKYQETEVIKAIASKFADSLMESIDMIFDMLLERGATDQQRVSKFRFKDYALSICGPHELREQDLDIVLKTHRLLAGKDFIELTDFRSIFEYPVAQAKKRRYEETVQRDQSLQEA
jgi:hypothetical protein